MKVAFGTDEHTSLTEAVRADVEARGHTVVAVDDGQWVEVGHAVGEAVASGACDTGVLFCWTGTGASIAANKVAGARAALCTDAATAAGDGEWAAVGARVGRLVASGACATGVLFCWTGTGASIAANKVRGVRAALCTDAATAAGAREWNDANVLVMGYMGLVTEDAVPGILDAWFRAAPKPEAMDQIDLLERG